MYGVLVVTIRKADRVRFSSTRDTLLLRKKVAVSRVSGYACKSVNESCMSWKLVISRHDSGRARFITPISEQTTIACQVVFIGDAPAVPIVAVVVDEHPIKTDTFSHNFAGLIFIYSLLAPPLPLP